MNIFKTMSENISKTMSANISKTMSDNIFMENQMFFLLLKEYLRNGGERQYEKSLGSFDNISGFQ